ncbi:MAG: hypothetical protein DCC71_03625 [Proteobacteria bacterium]|nr:MAG: hypothetical protein DCC71_03625 [Pseudomonadota bacterium]
MLATLPTRNASPWWCWGSAACVQPGWATIALRQDPGGVVVVAIPDKGWFTGARSVQADTVVRRVTENLLGRLAAAGPVDVYGGYAPPERARRGGALGYPARPASGRAAQRGSTT